MDKKRSPLTSEHTYRERNKMLAIIKEHEVPTVCPVCGGTGKLVTYPGFEEDCLACDGTGEVYG
jgi:DnaJ-class molecular chaperone